MPARRFLSKRLIIAVSLLAPVTIGATSPKAAHAAQNAPPPKTLTIWDHSWVVNGQMVHGIAGEGAVYHPDAAKPAKMIRFVLVAAGSPGNDDQMQDPQLSFGLAHQQVHETSHELIDLHHGAAYVELGELPGEMETLIARDVKSVAYSRYLALQREAGAAVPEMPRGEIEGEQRPIEVLGERALEQSLPRDIDGFDDFIRAFVKRESEKQDVHVKLLFQFMSQDEAMAAYFWYWPMIITHSVIAGAEGTKVVAVGVPGSGDGAADFHAFVKLVEGANAAVKPGDQPELPLPLGANMRFDISGDDSPTQTPSTPAQNTFVTTLQERMAPGWESAFPAGGDDDPQ